MANSAFDINLGIFGSIETLINDVQNVTSSEMSLKQFTALVEEEFHTESQHMVKKGGSQTCTKEKNKQPNWKINALPICLFIAKWMLGLMFIFLLVVVFVPERIADLMNSIPAFITNPFSEVKPSYSISRADWYFFALQLLRWSSTSFRVERRFPITDHDLDSCILDNPLYDAYKVKCSACRKISGFKYELNMKNNHFNHPIMLENQNIQFSLGRLQQVLHKNEMMINPHTVSIITNSAYVQTVEDLKNNHVLEQLEKDNLLHIVGTSVSYMSSHILRKDFARPQDYITHAAQTYKSYFYIDGKDSPSFELQTSIVESNFMYIQCSGSRRLVFTPPEHCHNKCQSFSKKVKGGDIVFYSSMWTVRSEASNDKSLAFVDNFEWMP